MTEIKLAHILEAIRLNSKRNLNIGRMRHDIEALADLFPPDPDVVCKPVASGALKGEWIFDAEQDLNRTILYLHGGGFVMGSVRSHRGVGSRIARSAAAKMLLIDYRLAPENRFPAALEDTVTAYEWLLNQGYDPRKIVIAGDSAGGNLALSALVALRDKGKPLPAATVLISPWLDMEASGQSMIENALNDHLVRRDRLIEKASAYLGDINPAHPLASPIRADLRGLPPLMIHVGSVEALLDDSKKLEKKAREDGVEVNLQVWAKMIHVWHFFAPVLPEGRQAIRIIGQFIKKHTALKPDK